MFLAAFLVSVVMLVVETSGAWGNNYKEIETGIDLFGSVYNKVLENYITESDPVDLSKKAINGIVESLDPYSTFLDISAFQQLQADTKGSFGGLGIEISTPKDYPRVMSYPIEGTPAEHRLRAGDEIVEIDGVSTFKMDLTKVVGMLRGEVGSEVSIKVKRGGSDDLLSFDIVRALIPLDNVRYAGVIDDGVGYIKLSRFNQHASKELDDAIDDLQKADVDGIILDLRYNPGGLLLAAVQVANKFLPKETKIVFTRDRNGVNEQLFAPDRAKLPLKPLVVLVNRGSASASEIVAGAIQDHDRGVLVGETTFGKGLVQTVFNDLPGGNGLKLTTSEYHTPSGRSIHKDRSMEELYEMEQTADDEDAVAPEDSLETREKFYTLNKQRVVYGGGGITPDLVVKDDTVGNIVAQLRYQSKFQDFAVKYVNSHPDLEIDFVVDEQMIEEFRSYISDEEQFEYTIPGKSYLDDFRKRVERELYNGDITEKIDELEQTLLDKRSDDFNASKDTIKLILRREIVAAKFGGAERAVASKDWDKQLQKAIEILQNPDMYDEILSQGAETGIQHRADAGE